MPFPASATSVVALGHDSSIEVCTGLDVGQMIRKVWRQLDAIQFEGEPLIDPTTGNQVVDAVTGAGLLRERIDPFFTRFKVLDALNEAYYFFLQQLAMDFEGQLETEIVRPFRAGQDRYDVPADFIKAKAVFRQGAGCRVPLRYWQGAYDVEITGSGGAAGVGYLPSFRFVGLQILFNPAPTVDEGLQTDGWVLRYIRWPPRLACGPAPQGAETDFQDASRVDPEFLAPWHDLLCVYATARLKHLDGQDASPWEGVETKLRTVFLSFLENRALPPHFVEEFEDAEYGGGYHAYGQATGW